LLLTSRLDVESAKTTVAVRLERMHVELIGRNEGLEVVVFGVLGFRGGHCACVGPGRYACRRIP
jgi:hypothetical protein